MVVVCVMRIAFKEWAIVVDALGRGEQIVILRKGGIAEGRGGFKVEHPEFLLFPTRFHQQRESVLPKAQARYDAISSEFPAADVLRLEFFGRIIDWRQIDRLEAVSRLKGQHIWRDEVVAERFDWGKSKNIFALAIRVYRLRAAAEISLLPEYGGCKSWVELREDISIDASVPVLSENEFSAKLQQFRETFKLTQG